MADKLGTAAARLALAALSLVSACAHARTPARRPAVEPTIEYRLRIDAALTTIEVRACFAGPLPRELTSGMGPRHLVTRAWLETGQATRPLAVRDRRISIDAQLANACVGYAIDASDAGRGSHDLELARIGDALVANTALLLWRPPDYPRYRALRATIVTAPGMQVSVPWPKRERGYALDASVFAFQAYAVFGHFELAYVSAPSARLEVAILPGLPEPTHSAVLPWIESAARTASLAIGVFPRSAAQVIVIPSAPAEVPVRFGSMHRGGGASAVLLLPANAELDALRRDWVAVHEFSHLLHPFIEREDAWLSEGIATYYQEVLRVRAGLLPEDAAWRRLLEGARLGHDAEGGLGQASAQMFASFDFKRVYWAGAAFALLADVELRRASHGAMSLDLALRALGRRGLAQARPWRAREVVAEIDRAAGSTLVSGLFTRYVAGQQFPELEPVYRELGLLAGDDWAVPPLRSEGAWIRDAIMHGESRELAGAHE